VADAYAERVAANVARERFVDDGDTVRSGVAGVERAPGEEGQSERVEEADVDRRGLGVLLGLDEDVRPNNGGTRVSAHAEALISATLAGYAPPSAAIRLRSNARYALGHPEHHFRLLRHRVACMSHARVRRRSLPRSSRLRACGACDGGDRKLNGCFHGRR
jgi:hypothetical protein